MQLFAFGQQSQHVTHEALASLSRCPARSVTSVAVTSIAGAVRCAAVVQHGRTSRRPVAILCFVPYVDHSPLDPRRQSKLRRMRPFFHKVVSTSSLFSSIKPSRCRCGVMAMPLWEQCVRGQSSNVIRRKLQSQLDEASARLQKSPWMEEAGSTYMSPRGLKIS